VARVQGPHTPRTDCIPDSGRERAIMFTMAGRLGKKTIDGITTARCMLVGVNDKQAAACAAALVPFMTVKVADADEACARMSTELPLLVVAARTIGEAGLSEIGDLATTCASELVVIDDPVPSDMAQRLYEALRRSDRRRTSSSRDD
jgi:hypothetical protein